MANKKTSVIVTRWQGSGHPTESAITRLLHKENLRPYMWRHCYLGYLMLDSAKMVN